jgi:mRNA-binding protein PUF3
MTLAEKLFDELSMADHKIFSNYVGPELVKARRTVSGKQIQAVEKKMHRFDTTDLSPGELVPATAAAASNPASHTPLTSTNSTPIPQISLPPGPPTPDSLTPRGPPLSALPSNGFSTQQTHH